MKILEPERKELLLAEFQKLQTLEEKLDFWEKQIGQAYIKFLVYMDASSNLPKELAESYGDLLEFRIYPKPTEFNSYNLRVLEDYTFFSKTFRHKRIPLSLSKKINDFEKKITEVLFNRKHFVETEIEKTKQEIEERIKETSSSFDNTSIFFKDTFEKNYYSGEEVTYNEQFYDLLDLIAVNDATVYAGYLEYLFEEFSRASKNNFKKGKEITLSQQLLLLNYLGVLDKLDHPDTNKKAAFINAIINKSYQNVRSALIYWKESDKIKVSEEKEERINDLREILSLLQEQGIKSAAKKVKADIEKLSQ